MVRRHTCWLELQTTGKKCAGTHCPVVAPDAKGQLKHAYAILSDVYGYLDNLILSYLMFRCQLEVLNMS
jgi:hypothetical protein